MATSSNGINETITANGDSDEFKLPRGSAVSLDAIRTAGSATLALEISFDGTTYVPARDSTGSLVTRGLDGTTEHWHYETLAQVDTYLKVVTTSASTANILVKVARVISE